MPAPANPGTNNHNADTHAHGSGTNDIAHMIGDGLGGFAYGVHLTPGVHHVPGLTALEVVTHGLHGAAHNTTSGNPNEDRICGFIGGAAEVIAGTAVVTGGALLLPELAAGAIPLAMEAASSSLVTIGLEATTAALVVDGSVVTALGSTAYNMISPFTAPVGDCAQYACHGVLNVINTLPVYDVSWATAGSMCPDYLQFMHSWSSMADMDLSLFEKAEQAYNRDFYRTVVPLARFFVSDAAHQMVLEHTSQTATSTPNSDERIAQFAQANRGTFSSYTQLQERLEQFLATASEAQQRLRSEQNASQQVQRELTTLRDSVFSRPETDSSFFRASNTNHYFSSAESRQNYIAGYFGFTMSEQPAPQMAYDNLFGRGIFGSSRDGGVDWNWNSYFPSSDRHGNAQSSRGASSGSVCTSGSGDRCTPGSDNSCSIM